MCKSFNGLAGKYRSMLIILLLEKNRLKLMSRFNDKYAKVTCYETSTTPNVRKLFYKLKSLDKWER